MQPVKKTKPAAATLVITPDVKREQARLTFVSAALSGMLARGAPMSNEQLVARAFEIGEVALTAWEGAK